MSTVEKYLENVDSAHKHILNQNYPNISLIGYN